jgi:hypothetical protein
MQVINVRRRCEGQRSRYTGGLYGVAALTAENLSGSDPVDIRAVPGTPGYVTGSNLIRDGHIHLPTALNV